MACSSPPLRAKSSPEARRSDEPGNRRIPGSWGIFAIWAGAVCACVCAAALAGSPAALRRGALQKDAKAASRSRVLRIGLVGAFGRPARLEVSSPSGMVLSPDAGGPSVQVDSAAAFGVVAGRVEVRGPNGSRLLDAAGVMAAPLQFSDGEKPATLTVCANGVCRQYRGTLHVTPAAEGRLLAVNQLDVEDYLRGVVPMEMNPRAPLEALKAQAIVSRTYALRLKGRFQREGFDLTDDTACQVYGGAGAERPSTDTAVRDTAGVVLVRNRQLVLADFYDDCGGVTAEGDGPGDYPPSVRDAPPSGPDYCGHGKYHTWDLQLTPEQLTLLLRRAFPGQFKSAIEDVSVEAVDASGRARRVAVRTAEGSSEITGTKFRAAIGVSRLKSTLFTIAREPGGAFVFSGRGYGHGHGMCQEGAQGMAAEPYNNTHEQILAHYFPGAALAGDYGASAVNP